MLRRLTLGMAVIMLPFAAAQLVAAPAEAAPSVVTLHYDASDLPDYQAETAQAVANWNGLEHNVQLSAGGNATILLHEVNGGGSYTQTDGHGNGDIYIDVQQVAQGFDPTRIIAHEFGHNLGLPDDYSGPCEEVMSGHGPGTSCKNAVPDAQEAAQVDQNFANGFAATSSRRVTQD
ncbi:snapalysin family zinc-dependent metalloprotease [Kutzneria sp. CA-103260]|uniref:snapalysin family zinc-dependent metalloprotease n=1 Tax=Kutzneria sp. CA-103260 TaxID=2802641 RepID=UPI001BAC9EAB|nr:snapalysin family zinc-dependent metalloprotease [Kutzneria sp. CA-103260]QUQ64121.1 Peptidase M7 [Kutzneria sp. CA-103260]